MSMPSLHAYRLSQESEDAIYKHRMTLSALASSLVSTIAGFPLDSVKSRLQVQKYSSVFACVQQTFKEEGIQGFFRGVGVPLVTITAVRTTSFSIYDHTKKYLNREYALKDNPLNVAATGFAGGAVGGILISFGSCAFELVKVRAQLEALMSQAQGRPFQTTGTFRGAFQLYRNNGIRGLYFGFPLHLSRDTFGTGIYYALYDSLRRKSQSNTHILPAAAAPFVCGSASGILSWIVIYPVDLVKTRVQRDALEGKQNRPSAWSIAKHLYSKGFTRMYRGLGVSAVRSMFTHGLTWTLIESVSKRISARYEQLR